jgi:thermitase
MKYAILIITLFAQFSNAHEFEEGKILIKFKETPFKSKFSYPLKLQEVLNLFQGKISIFKVIDYPKKLNKEGFLDLIEKLNQDPFVEIASPNYYYYPEDDKFNLQWGLYNNGSFNIRFGVAGIIGADINAPSAWKISTGDININIAVIDTGIDYFHPDLKNQMWINQKEANGVSGVDDDGNGQIDDIYGYDFANGDSDPLDDHGHGTHVAGTIGASHNDFGVKGVMGNVSLMAIKYMPNNGPGVTENAIRCIDYALKMGAQIINASWGGGTYDPLLLDAIKSANVKGVMFVTAAGNKSTNNDLKPHYPSDYDSPNIISVAATDASDALTMQSNFGAGSVDVAAPGADIYSTLPDSKYGIMNGTSSSTAFVTGALGLLLSREKNLSVVEIKSRLISTSVEQDNLRNKIKPGGGRIDVYNLLKNIRPPRISEKNLVWEDVPIEPFESLHPYVDRTELTKTIKIPGAKFIRVVFEEFDMEKRYDFVELTSGNGSVVDRISEKGQNYISNFTSGDTITINFMSDFVNNGWGFLIKEVQVVR